MKKLFTFAIAALALFTSCNQAQKTEEKQRFFIGDDIAIAQTKYGKIQGYILDDVYTFLGVPYGAPTSGENRFMAPKEPESWDDIRPAVFYGNCAPQEVAGKFTNSMSTAIDHWNYHDVSEDCLCLNVWTPNLDGKKRPVIVWFHGGGYTFGNAIEQDGYKGNNLSREGDVVFVSVNHRLGAMGFSDFSAYGEKYANSSNVGVLDLVAALKWVNENITNFGGDPSNVTIIGQSGGGAKVCTVLAMEAAKGLVHKAVALSGHANRAMSQEVSRGIAEYILKEAGLTASNIDKLQEMPWQEYNAIANKAAQKYREDHPEIGRGGFAPVEDGINLPIGGYFQKDGHASNIPTIFCSTMAEQSISRTDAKLEEMTKEEAVEYLAKMHGQEKAVAIIEASQKAFPELKPVEWVNMVMFIGRKGVIESADAKCAQGAPVYNCWFGYKANLFNGRMRAFHCSDICYWFKNTDQMYTHTGGGPEPKAISEKMSAALLSFMKTGNPNCEAVPTWPEYKPESRAVMMMDKTFEVKNDPDAEIRAAL